MDYEKTWQFDMNRAYANAPGSGETTFRSQSRYLLWYTKAFLTGQVGGATQGLWTVAGSSDAVTGGMDGVDRWGTPFDPAKLVYSSSAIAHSWIVLRSPLIRGHTYWLLLDWYTGYDYALTLKLDTQAPTGGSATAAPTLSAGAFGPTITYGVGISGTSLTYMRPGPMKMHGMLATDGSFNILASRDYTNTFYYVMSGTVLSNGKAADEYPFVIGAIANDGTGAGAGTNNDWFGDINCTMRVPTGTLGSRINVIRPNSTNCPNGPDAFDGTWGNLPVWLGYQTVGTNQYRAIRGRVPDQFFCPGGPTYSTGTRPYPLAVGAVDNNTTPQWMLVGDYWLPTNAVPLL